MSFSWIFLASIAAALAPIAATLCSSYIKVSIVVGLLRSGLGAQQIPGSAVIFGFSFALTLFIMEPVAQRSIEAAQQINPQTLKEPFSAQMFTELRNVCAPWREFLIRHTGKRELKILNALRAEQRELSVNENRAPRPIDYGMFGGPNVGAAAQPADSEVEFGALLLAYLSTEVRQAFVMGVLLLIPFLIIDLFLANILVGLGLTMLSPMSIALPIKLMLFVWADGWLILSQSLIRSYAAGAS